MPLTAKHMDLVEEIKGRIYRFVDRRGSASFAKINEYFGEGNDEMVFQCDPNIIIWSGMRAEVAQAITESMNEYTIVLVCTAPITYIIDGCVLDLPLAKRSPKAGYKTPHWSPMIIDTYEHYLKTGGKDFKPDAGEVKAGDIS